MKDNKTHYLKCWPEYFLKLRTGEKTFEVRLNDRNYQVGDILINQEWEPVSGTYTGDEVKHEVTYILENYDALKPDFVVMALSPQKECSLPSEIAEKMAMEFVERCFGNHPIRVEDRAKAADLNFGFKEGYKAAFQSQKDLVEENEKLKEENEMLKTEIKSQYRKIEALTAIHQNHLAEIKELKKNH